MKMVIETSRPIARVAKELGINEGTLGNWVGIYRREHAGEEPPLTVSERVCPFRGVCHLWVSCCKQGAGGERREPGFAG